MFSVGTTDAVHSEILSTYAVDPNVENEYRPEIDQILAKYEDKMKGRQALVGIVTSIKCAKSATVLVKRHTFVSKYNKFVGKIKKIMAHDPNSICRLGD